MQVIYDAVHEANPTARFVTFGYDLMGFASEACSQMPLMLTPDCDGDPFCVNTQWLQIQSVMNEMAAENTHYDVVNLLGSLQSHAGIPNTAPGQPDLRQYSPPTTYDSTCIHPTEDGYHTIFTNFYNSYFSKTKP
eukprot:TRINITY_DN6326_c0_g1_i1.p1 TRINITY_DN6326_c0_g1~~TRINITY_DN6326_c0_g1_i1.p1  ORF type:complete len:135 (+),score=30.90 TRINITY_DN6326_c0_g1_i1:413-817(+)